MSINKPAVKPILLGKKVILKPDKRPTVGSDSLVTSSALADALHTKIIIDSEGNINSASDIVIGKLGEDTAFYIIDPGFMGIKYKKIESPELGKLYYDKFTKTYYTFQGNILEDNVGIVGYKFEPLVLPSIVKVTWQELKDLRDNSRLIPGLKYRITDYQCTTTQENTQSAGHQFDIVLLALSENKLAEEGWAMMHDNIYDVTFNDGVTKKCYAFNYLVDGDPYYNIVDCDTMLGLTSEITDLEIDEDSKTISTVYDSTDLIIDGRTYNYFQNSNLSAWKVWYCLDNDTDRFAWAMDVEPASVIITDGRSEFSSIRTLEGDANNKYCWLSKNSSAFWTDSETPQNGDSIYNANAEVISGLSIVSYSPLQEGRGVIYRLIDEWNNDVPYDFKNIQFYIENTNLWVYAITDDDAIEEDPTLDGIRVKAIHLLSNYNNNLSSISTSKLGRNPLVNVIFLNNGDVYFNGSSNTLVRDGQNVLT